MKSLSLAATLLLLAACGGDEAGQQGNRPLDNAIAAAASGDEPARPVAAGTPAEPFRWTGRFAATPELCRGGVWDIGEERIVTDGHTACDVDTIAQAAGQVTLGLSCTAEGTNSSETWVLTGQEGGMRVRRYTGLERIDIDLIRCG